MSDINYNNYTFPNTPFVFDKIYKTEKDLRPTEDGVFPTRYILVEENSKGEKAIVYQKIIGNDGVEYKKIAVLDYSNQAYEQVDQVLGNYIAENGNSVILAWRDLDATEEAII